MGKGPGDLACEQARTGMAAFRGLPTKVEYQAT